MECVSHRSVLNSVSVPCLIYPDDTFPFLLSEVPNFYPGCCTESSLLFSSTEPNQKPLGDFNRYYTVFLDRYHNSKLRIHQPSTPFHSPFLSLFTPNPNSLDIRTYLTNTVIRHDLLIHDPSPQPAPGFDTTTPTKIPIIEVRIINAHNPILPHTPLPTPVIRPIATRLFHIAFPARQNYLRRRYWYGNRRRATSNRRRTAGVPGVSPWARGCCRVSARTGSFMVPRTS